MQLSDITVFVVSHYMENFRNIAKTQELCYKIVQHMHPVSIKTTYILSFVCQPIISLERYLIEGVVLEPYTIQVHIAHL